MIFCGDIALPFANGITFNKCPNELLSEPWVGNLEGSLIMNDPDSILHERKVFNNSKAVNCLCSQFHFICYIIANNHLMDAASVQTTLDNLDALKIQHIGAGNSIDEACKEFVYDDYVIVAFGWEGISCYPSTNSREGVNSYEKDEVLSQIEALLEKYPGKRIIPFMHWNYELELYPQPLDRELAHRLIDMGVYAVIGCHAHRVQPIEIYKGHPIVYGLGNFAFMQNTFMNGNLKFPEFSYPEIAFEITDDGEYKVHHYLYDSQRQTVTFQKTTVIEDAPFSGKTNYEYKRFFKNNRVQKKLLPIFYFEDSKITYLWKIKLVKIRQELIKCIIGNKQVFNAIKRVMTKLS